MISRNKRGEGFLLPVALPCPNLTHFTPTAHICVLTLGQEALLSNLNTLGNWAVSLFKVQGSSMHKHAAV